MITGQKKGGTGSSTLFLPTTADIFINSCLPRCCRPGNVFLFEPGLHKCLQGIQIRSSRRKDLEDVAARYVMLYQVLNEPSLAADCIFLDMDDQSRDTRSRERLLNLLAIGTHRLKLRYCTVEQKPFCLYVEVAKISAT